MKAILQAAIQLRAGNMQKVGQIYQQNSIAYHKRTLYPKGVAGVVLRGFVTTRKTTKLRRFLGALRVYTCWVKPQPTVKDWARIQVQITDPYKGLPLGKMPEWFSAHARELGIRVPKEHGPSINGFKPSKGIYLPEKGVGGKDIPYFRHILSLATTRPPAAAPDVFLRLGMPALSSLAQQCVDQCENFTTGRIEVIADRGLKNRGVAIPSFWFQLTLKALHDQLDAINKQLTVSCSHFQSKGAYFLEEKLLDGETVHCFDLSSATDRFPLGLQLAVLDGLDLGQWNSILTQATKRWDLNGSIVDYEVGQPMGLYSSFPLFHLTHILLLIGICKTVGVEPAKTFVVLGDDVAICDNKVAATYEKALHHLGVEVSDPKTIRSDKVAEFAGFVSVNTRTGKVSTFRPYKFGTSGSVQSLYNLFHFLGKPLRKDYSINKFYQEYDELRQNSDPDLSPWVISDDPGGIPGETVDATRLMLTIGEIFYNRGSVAPYYVDSRRVALELLGQREDTQSLVNPRNPVQDPDGRRPLTAAPAKLEDPKLEDLFREDRLKGNDSRTSGSDVVGLHMNSKAKTMDIF
jgi:hypothetical protein